MKRIFLTALLLSTLGAVALPALAQRVHGGTPLEMLAGLKPQLNLNTSQQQQWDSAIAQGKAARDTEHASFGQVKAALQTELGKAEPDFVAIAAITDNATQQNVTLRKQVRDAWLALYATFSPEQKAIARDAIKSGMERVQARRAAHERTPRAN